MPASVAITIFGGNMRKVNDGLTEPQRFYRNHKKKRIQEAGAYWRKTKKMALEALGGKCVRCGFTDERALQFDHVNGGGVKDKKATTRQYHKVIIESFLNGENKFQILCANCNWIKRFENNEVRKGPIKNHDLWR